MFVQMQFYLEAIVLAANLAKDVVKHSESGSQPESELYL